MALKTAPKVKLEKLENMSFLVSRKEWEAKEEGRRSTWRQREKAAGGTG